MIKFKAMKYSLEGVDGNAFAIMAYVKGALRKEGKTKQDMDKYVKSATSGDYANLISVSVETLSDLG